MFQVLKELKKKTPNIILLHTHRLKKKFIKMLNCMLVLIYFEVLSAFLLKIFYSPNSNALFSFKNRCKMMRNTCEIEKQMTCRVTRPFLNCLLFVSAFHDLCSPIFCFFVSEALAFFFLLL